ncbi:hypothetical protein [Desulfofarcimen acetoxidans]|nr:hypothetical protein [Desulfofarcimen acetoxidans]
MEPKTDEWGKYADIRVIRNAETNEVESIVIMSETEANQAILKNIGPER